MSIEFRAVTVAAFQRIIGLEARPFVQRQLEPVVEEFLAGVDAAEQMAPDLLRGLHLAGDLVGPVVRNVAIRAARAYAGAVGEMDRGLQLREHVVAHLVAAGAEFLGVGQFQRGVEAAPEHHAGHEAREHQHAEPEHRARPPQHVPQFDDKRPQPRQPGPARRRRIEPRSSPSSGSGAAQHGVDVDEVVVDRRLHHVLRHVAFGAEEAARRHRGEELAVAIHEMGDADHRRLRFSGAGAGMTGQAFVAVDVDLIALDVVRDHRRLLRIVPHFLLGSVAQRRHRRRGALLVERGRSAQAGTHGLRDQRRRSGRER